MFRKLPSLLKTVRAVFIFISYLYSFSLPLASLRSASTGAVKIFMNIAELFVRYMGVDLGGGDVGVAEEGLDGADVGAVA